MRRAGVLLLAAAIALQLTPSSGQAESPTNKLTGKAAWSALVGNTVVGKLNDKEFVDHYLADGTVKSTVENQSLAGKWSLEDDKVCFVYPDEPKACYAMEVADDAATFTDASGLTIRTQILKGNPRNL